MIEGPDAMRVSILSISLALAVCCGSLGCKSAPKMSWWKTADKTDALANAPQLPSEVAKQAEALAGADPVKITTPVTTSTPAATSPATAMTTAPAYVASEATPDSYPSTGAQGYVSTTSAAATTTTASTSGGTAASAAMPYDPTAVPPAASYASTPAATSTVPTQPDRYGLSAEDRYVNAYPSTSTDVNQNTGMPSDTPASYPTTSEAVGSAPAITNVATASTDSSVPFVSYPGSASLGDRYATQPPAASPVSTTVAAGAPVQPASAVASVQPYRPGGTGTYPGTSANYEVATRPTTTSTTPSSYPNTGSGQYR